ncbi:MAG: hypothetical protein FJ121_13595 [Deltaproteobacteria bacterium]|nr:hypothetical protein [Deltaproteobacteria bacterium]
MSQEHLTMGFVDLASLCNDELSQIKSIAAAIITMKRAGADVEEEYHLDIANHVEEMAVLILEKEHKIREVLADLFEKVGMNKINTPAAEETQDHIQ